MQDNDSPIFPESNPSEPVRIQGSEEGSSSSQRDLQAELCCLVAVDHFKTGGLRDQLGQVIARWRDIYHRVIIGLPRPQKGIRMIPCNCPICGKPMVLQTRSWFRTNLLVLIS